MFYQLCFLLLYRTVQEFFFARETGKLYKDAVYFSFLMCYFSFLMYYFSFLMYYSSFLMYYFLFLMYIFHTFIIISVYKYGKIKKKKTNDRLSGKLLNIHDILDQDLHFLCYTGIRYKQVLLDIFF